MISVVIPCHNAEKSLGACLEAIFKSSLEDFEVIVVDDCSRDSSRLIAGKFPCRVINLATPQGAGHARNRGVLSATGDIIVFIDADVVIGKEYLSIMRTFLTKNSDIHSIVGMLDEHCPYRNFFSQYKNLYMNYVFSNLSENITFIYSSLYAVRRCEYFPFNELLPVAEDTELGLRLTASGKKIRLLKELTVTHLKEHGFFSILKNDFRIPYYWAQIFSLYSSPVEMVGEKKFAHAQISQIVSILVCPALLVTSFFALYFPPVVYWFAAFLLLAFSLCNGNFLMFLLKKRGLSFFVKSICFTFADQIVMFTAISLGMLKSLFLRGKEGQ